MEEEKARQLVADTGRILLKKGLVARTWGNISCRVSEDTFAISPSGLDYETMQAADVPLYHTADGTWEGTRKPSSEKKIHAAAYALYPDVQVVIHTHQDYATAMSLTGAGDLRFTPEEKKLLGRIPTAAYGLPGTDKLKNNVEAALKRGARIVLMAHHGALILGTDLEDALQKAQVLEQVCRRRIEAVLKAQRYEPVSGKLRFDVNVLGPYALLVKDDNILYAAQQGGFHSQLDDIAQMLGERLGCAENRHRSVSAALRHTDAVLVEGVGCVINAKTADDAQALELLIAKACLAKRYTDAMYVRNDLSGFDCRLMETVFKLKYAKQKKA